MTRASALVLPALVLAGLALAGVPSAEAQTLRSDRYAATEPGAWSPLWLPGTPRWRWEARALGEPATTPGGLAFEVGNPAALAFELDDGRARFEMGSAAEAGPFRAPSEPGEVDTWRAGGMGWRPVGGGGVAGGAEVERATLGAPALATLPGAGYATPVASFDTSASDLRELSARVHGVGGWTFGPVSIGLGAGVLATERRTIRAPTPRRARGATTAGVAGIAWRPAGGALRLGVHARRARSAETALVYTVAAGTRVYHVWGFGEASPIDLSTLYYRRGEQDAWSAGAGAAGRTLGTDWVVGWETGAEEDRQSSITRNDPPADIWSARGHRAVASLRRPDADGRDRLVVRVEWEAVGGDMAPVEVDSAQLRVEAMRIETEASLRLPIAGPWAARAMLGFDLYDEHRWDARVRVASDVDVWRPRAALALDRETARWGARLRGSFESLAPGGALPDPRFMGDTFLTYVAPELGLLATTRRSLGLGARVWLNTAGARFWVDAASLSLTPQTTAALPRAPSGERTVYRVSLGVDLR